MSGTRSHTGERKGKGKEAQSDRKARGLAEWISLAVSIAIVTVIAGLVVYANLARPDAPPVIELVPHVAEVREENGGYYLPVEVTNSGGHTVEELEVRLMLTSGGEAETALLSVPFLADGETVRGAVVFSRPPTEGELAVTFSFLEP